MALSKSGLMLPALVRLPSQQGGHGGACNLTNP